jgi:hypothetical protein
MFLSSFIPVIICACVDPSRRGSQIIAMNFWNEVPIAEIIISLLSINFHFKLISEITPRISYFVSIGALFFQSILFACVMHPSHVYLMGSHFNLVHPIFVLSADVLLCLFISVSCVRSFFFLRRSEQSDDSFQLRFYNLYANIAHYSFFKLTCMREFHFAYLAAHFVFPFMFASFYYLDWSRARLCGADKQQPQDEQVTRYPSWVGQRF